MHVRVRGSRRGPIPVSIFGAAPKEEDLQDYAEMGIERVLFTLPSEPAEKTLPRLEKYAALAKSIA